MVYRRESNGYLSYLAMNRNAPEAKSPDQYCPETGASDPTEHLAVGYSTIDPGENTIDGFALGTYTVSSEGTPSTKSNYTNMPALNFSPDILSISPSGELLAAASGSGFYEFFHYNGGSPITKYLGPFSFQTHGIRAFGWDKSNHFYDLTDSAVIPYDLTPSTYKELTPYPISAPYSMIVLTVK